MRLLIALYNIRLFRDATRSKLFISEVRSFLEFHRDALFRPVVNVECGGCAVAIDEIDRRNISSTFRARFRTKVRKEVTVVGSIRPDARTITHGEPR